MGLFHEFLEDDDTDIFGVEAAGKGIETGQHAASLTGGQPGILHGNRTYLLQDENGQIRDAHSISAGLDYPGIGPEHAWLHEIGRAKYVSITDVEHPRPVLELRLYKPLGLSRQFLFLKPL